MKTFLEFVAEDIIKKFGTDLSRIAIVFPNKRAALFMNRYLARIAGKPIWSPSYITISEFFRKNSKLIVADQIKLICDLHKSFIDVTGTNETLDHFYGWGQILLADFDDIDKNMADADKVFSNIKDIRELDDTSYLTAEQRDLLKRFFVNFTDEQESELKRRFMSLWQHFHTIYHDYNERLGKQGLAYEGALYRIVATQEKIDIGYDQYIFVGFNLLHEVEQTIFLRLQKMNKARFYWDFDNYYVAPDGKQSAFAEAGQYIAMYLQHFPNELDIHARDIYDNMCKAKSISFISASTNNAQARYVGKWLSDEARYKGGARTAVVMCDENILLPVIHSLPPEADKVNITTGYPMGMTPMASLIVNLFDLYTLGCDHRHGKNYRTQYVDKVLTHPYTRFISKRAKEIHQNLKVQHILYPKREMLTYNDEDEGMVLLFPKEKDETNEGILSQICAILKHIGINGRNEDNVLFQESVFNMYTIFNRLLSLTVAKDLCVDSVTLRRLIKQLISTTSIPFHGEPIVGIQVMGVLETRNLDFDHLLLLSCNEGNMPKGVDDSSFIPYSIRKAYGLTTVDNKVAIYSYYFHRLIQRAPDVTITYNNSTDNGNTGEKSRFMLQLMVDSRQPIKNFSLQSNSTAKMTIAQPIKKDKIMLGKLESMKRISPTAINTYLRCPLLFFFQYIAGIKEPDCDADTVDNRMFGNIFHKSAQLIYANIKTRDGIVEKGVLQKLINNRRIIERIVDQAFDEELFNGMSGNSNAYNYNGLQIINREVIIEYLVKLLKRDVDLAPFSILGLELKAYQEINFNVGEKIHCLNIGGYIDRLDMITDNVTGEQQIRVVDYKTGSPASSVPQDISDVFRRINIAGCHSNYYLQTILYSLTIAESKELNPLGKKVCPALFFVKQAMNDGYNPILLIGRRPAQPMNDITEYKDEFYKLLKETLAEIYNPEVSFTPTLDNKNNCKTCSYKRLCQM